MSQPTVVVRREETTGWVVLSNPAKLNAVGFGMWTELAAAIHALETDDAVRVIALTGDGDRAFVAGADISEFGERRARPAARADYDDVTAAAMSALLNTPKPTVAVIRGICFGGGVGIAASCDMRLARDDAQFCVPAARLGLGYHFGGVERLVSIVGPAFAAEIFATARRYTAAEAAGMRLVNHVRDAASFDEFVADYLRQIGANAPLTVAAATRAVREAVKPESRRDVEAVDRMVEGCFLSEDYREGRSAFAEKRVPRFHGR